MIKNSDFEAAVLSAAKDQIDKIAEQIKKDLVQVTLQAMTEYYAFPEGSYYQRTNQFFRAYRVYGSSDLSVPERTVGIIFDKTPNYIKHGSGTDSFQIYGWNLEGFHGGNGNSGNILQIVNNAADMMIAILSI